MQEDFKWNTRDMSNVNYFHCHEHGNFSTNCPQKKKKNKVVGSAVGEGLASKFEIEISLIACTVSSALGFCVIFG